MENTFELEITDIAFGGNGLGRKDGFVYFVSGTLPGELIIAEEISRRKNFGTARLVEILRSSQNRINPACPLAYSPSKNQAKCLYCPGCSYQHVKYEEEIRIKNRHLENFIRHNLKIDHSTVMDSPTPSPSVLNYRNKIVLHLSENRLGYFSDDNVSIVDVKDCPIAGTEINAKLAEIRKDLNKYSGAADITFRYTLKDQVQFWIENRPVGGVLEEETAFGTLEVPCGSFFQVNLKCADLLAAETAKMAKDSNASSLVDLYCGCGFFSIAAAKAGIGSVIGVDSDPDTIKSAVKNAISLGLADKCRFSSKSAEIYMTENSRKMKADDTVVLLDPPRGGLSLKLKNQLISTGVKKLIYISCAPDMMSRDMKFLCECGFKLKKVRLFDMFPRTSHFETIAYLEK
ncbi:MAG: 50S ribosomal protein L11 methyltransferase [Victivallales bacterium]|jgi:tRNA/tmRNA/rRNA uracil-C5-methylase (TrmA/RlmC/RlmD family)